MRSVEKNMVGKFLQQKASFPDVVSSARCRVVCYFLPQNIKRMLAAEKLEEMEYCFGKNVALLHILQPDYPKLCTNSGFLLFLLRLLPSKRIDKSVWILKGIKYKIRRERARSRTWRFSLFYVFKQFLSENKIFLRD